MFGKRLIDKTQPNMFGLCFFNECLRLEKNATKFFLGLVCLGKNWYECMFVLAWQKMVGAHWSCWDSFKTFYGGEVTIFGIDAKKNTSWPKNNHFVIEKNTSWPKITLVSRRHDYVKWFVWRFLAFQAKCIFQTVPALPCQSIDRLLIIMP